MRLTTLKNTPMRAGTRVLLRAELNVPVENSRVLDAFRLTAALPTMRYLAKRGAKTIILAHLGRAGASLSGVAEILARDLPLSFAPEVCGARARAAAGGLRSGGLLLLENVRSDPREEQNDEAFARELAGYGELFINDAFAVSHRAHASVVGVPKFLPAFAGLRLEKEVAELSHAQKPPSPSLCIMGGAKFETKGPLIEKFLESYDRVFVGGALANDVLKAQGLEVGASLVSNERYDFSRVLGHPKLLLPLDVVVESGGKQSVKKPAAVAAVESICDAGPDTGALLAALARRSRFILWNGPVGYYERGYGTQTEALARAVAGSGAYSVVGGGDTVAAIAKLNLLERFGFVSTGGGAMLEFLEKGTLPGIEALRAA